MMIFIIHRGMLSLVNEAICDHPEWLETAAFREEFVRLLFTI